MGDVIVNESFTMNHVCSFISLSNSKEFQRLLFILVERRIHSGLRLILQRKLP